MYLPLQRGPVPTHSVDAPSFGQFEALFAGVLPAHDRGRLTSALTALSPGARAACYRQLAAMAPRDRLRALEIVNTVVMERSAYA